jgi:hypothetical protein
MTDKNQRSEFNFDDAMESEEVQSFSETLKRIGERLLAVKRALEDMCNNDPADWWKNPSEEQPE